MIEEYKIQCLNARKSKHFKLRKVISVAFKKIIALSCVTGVVIISNLPLLDAYEAHVINVTAEVVNDVPNINPPGGEFCNDGILEVILSINSSTLAGADIYYTINNTDNNTDPDCYAPNGELYVNSFGLPDGVTIVKARSCHDGKQSAIMSEEFDVSAAYCESTLKINKVYYDVDGGHGVEGLNEWVELYNPSAGDVNIKNWEICDNTGCDVLSLEDLFIGSGKYALIANQSDTWQYWNIPDDVIKIELNNAIGGGLANGADMVILKNANGGAVDQMNWGTPNPGWANYNTSVWDPGATDVDEGCMLGRIPVGFDTNNSSDFYVFCPPEIVLTYPVGHEIWHPNQLLTIRWQATNPIGSDDDLSIDIYYITDNDYSGNISSGDNVYHIANNIANLGAFDWTLNPGFYGDVWIKILATGPNNFMNSDFAISGEIWEPPLEEDSEYPSPPEPYIPDWALNLPVEPMAAADDSQDDLLQPDADVSQSSNEAPADQDGVETENSANVLEEANIGGASDNNIGADADDNTDPDTDDEDDTIIAKAEEIIDTADIPGNTAGDGDGNDGDGDLEDENIIIKKEDNIDATNTNGGDDNTDPDTDDEDNAIIAKAEETLDTADIPNIETNSGDGDASDNNDGVSDDAKGFTQEYGANEEQEYGANEEQEYGAGGEEAGDDMENDKTQIDMKDELPIAGSVDSEPAIDGDDNDDINPDESELETETVGAEDAADDNNLEEDDISDDAKGSTQEYGDNEEQEYGANGGADISGIDESGIDDDNDDSLQIENGEIVDGDASGELPITPDEGAVIGFNINL